MFVKEKIRKYYHLIAFTSSLLSKIEKTYNKTKHKTLVIIYIYVIFLLHIFRKNFLKYVPYDLLIESQHLLKG